MIPKGDLPKGKSVDRSRKARALIWAACVLVTSPLALSGCTSQLADMRSLEPADAPVRPKEPGAYLPVNDLPRDRDDATISPEERAKIEKELMAARDRQASVPAKNAAGK
jgi:hypothetical protein